MALHHVVLVLWILFEVAVLSGHRDIRCGMERIDESAGIYYENLGTAA